MYEQSITHLPFLDLHTLRLTNHYFHALIPPPTHLDLVKAEMSEFHFLTCEGCTRLRPTDKFSSKMTKKNKGPHGYKSYSRFGIDCGRRPLPVLNRYTRGVRWDERGVPFVRCLKCIRVAQAPNDRTIKTSCHKAIGKVRAAAELEKVQREAREWQEKTEMD